MYIKKNQFIIFSMLAALLSTSGAMQISRAAREDSTQQADAQDLTCRGGRPSASMMRKSAQSPSMTRRASGARCAALTCVHESGQGKPPFDSDQPVPGSDSEQLAVQNSLPLSLSLSLYLLNLSVFLPACLPLLLPPSHWGDLLRAVGAAV